MLSLSLVLQSQQSVDGAGLDAGLAEQSNRNYQLLCQILHQWQLCEPTGDSGDVQVALRTGLAHGPTVTGSDGQGEMSPGWLRSVLQGWQERNVGEHLLFVNWEDLRWKHDSTINLEYHRAP